MSARPFISHFSPQRTDPELLERIHVQEERRHLLEESVSAMRESVLTANKHHLLFIGPRGAGKTHLVRLIHHRLS
ncbi:MAG: ArsR family transcriptional regulator, partial [Prosthecobacter sp.]